ncbi:MAG: hypothetical protein PSY12_04530 [bacterium]|nr:hypothetical protein [bacterium]
MEKVTAKEIAEQFDLDPKWLRHNLRQENFAWHPVKNARWIVARGSAEAADMVRVARKLSGK